MVQVPDPGIATHEGHIAYLFSPNFNFYFCSLAIAVGWNVPRSHGSKHAAGASAAATTELGDAL
jgi:hypothetical protein